MEVRMTKKRQKKKNDKKAPPKQRNWLAVHAHNRKGGAHVDRKKQDNKSKCRGRHKDVE
jgi:hypothetical protein